MMQDRFKFRVWSKRECKYVEYYLDDDLTFAIDIDGKLIAYASNYSDYANCDNGDFDDSHIVEFCTGLKDKNVKLIYEGDLIKEPANKYPLEIYYDKGAWLTREYRKNGNNEQLLYVLINCYGVEVIGNIHENPDLLENKDESI